MIDLTHRAVIDLTHLFAQAGLIDGAYLFQKHDGIFGQPALFAVEGDVGGQPGFIPLAGDSRRDDGGAVAVAHVILYDEHRSHTALFRPCLLYTSRCV